MPAKNIGYEYRRHYTDYAGRDLNPGDIVYHSIDGMEFAYRIVKLWKNDTAKLESVDGSQRRGYQCAPCECLTKVAEEKYASAN